jgi:hypothetical protein
MARSPTVEERAVPSTVLLRNWINPVYNAAAEELVRHQPWHGNGEEVDDELVTVDLELSLFFHTIRQGRPLYSTRKPTLLAITDAEV